MPGSARRARSARYQSVDRGRAVILRSNGEKVAESQLYESAQGLAWRNSGKEIWFTSPLEAGEVHGLTLTGKNYASLAVPGRLRIHDISPDGEILAEQGLARRGIVVSSNHGQSVKDLSWLDFGFLRAVSDDGKTILFEEEGTTGGGYTVFVRDIDGSPAVALGPGYAIALSHDKRWALSQRLTLPNQELWLLPLGPGEARRISPPNLQPLIGANFFSDGKRIIYAGREPGRPARAWVQDLDGNIAHPITPEGTAGFLVSPDDKWLLVNGRRIASNGLQQPAVAPVSGGNTKEIAGLKPDDIILGWTADNQLFVGTPNLKQQSFHVDKLNPFTGTRASFRDMYGPAIAGVFPDPPIFTPDGATYAFDYRVRMSDLYVVSGVR